MKKFLVVAVGLLLVVGGILFLKGAQIASLIGWATEAEKAGMPPVPVATVEATHEKWERTLRFTGSLRPVQGVTLAVEEGGTISRIAVENGATVRQGDLLVEIDTRRERADLASAEAKLRLAGLNLDRARGLLDKRIVAQSELDSAQAGYDEALAAVESLKATIAKKTITAPFSGRVGIREVNLGQTVRPGDLLMPLHSSDPIFVEFAVPQTRLADVRMGQRVRVTGDGLSTAAEGEVTAINPQVDEASRTARVQGTLANPDGVMRPGQFVEVDVVLPGADAVVAIPASSVVRSPFGDSVFVIEEAEGKMVARQQFVTLGGLRGDFVAVEKGLSPGARVVSAGAFKLSNGAVVAPNDGMQPEPSRHPTPENS
jgi:membrane fusion protein (multidrug efflux system)